MWDHFYKDLHRRCRSFFCNSLDFTNPKLLKVLSADESVFQEWIIEIIVVDADNDGVNSDTDCDDSEPLAYPGNTEILYDGIDNDCDPSTLDDGSLGLINEKKKHFEVYPNPTKGMIFIKGDVSKLTAANVYSLVGKHLIKIENNFNLIDISHLSSGIYWISLNSENGNTTYKIIKE